MRQINPKAEWVWGNWKSDFGPCEGCPNRDARFRWQPAMSGGSMTADLAFVADAPSSGKERTRKDFESNDHHKIVPDAYAEAEYWSDDWLVRKSSEPIFTDYLMPLISGIESIEGLDDIYYTNIKKCHDVEGSDDKNRQARERCSIYLQPELEVVQPRVVVPIGGRAIRGVREVYDLDISSTLKESSLRIYGADPAIVPSYHWGSFFRGRNNPTDSKIKNIDDTDHYLKELGNIIESEL